MHIYSHCNALYKGIYIKSLKYTKKKSSILNPTTVSESWGLSSILKRQHEGGQRRRGETKDTKGGKHVNCSIWLSAQHEETDYSAKWKWTFLIPNMEVRPNRRCRWIGPMQGWGRWETRGNFLSYLCLFFTWTNKDRADARTNLAPHQTIGNLHTSAALVFNHEHVMWHIHFETVLYYKYEFSDTLHFVLHSIYLFPDKMTLVLCFI